jgi:hypothetical protein
MTKSQTRKLLHASFFAGMSLFAHGQLRAEFPSSPGEDTWSNRPNDPSYESAWNLYSHLPVDFDGAISTREAEMGSGISVDKAWQLHTGRADTVVAVLDSGIYWDAKDLVDRYFLNQAELPVPQHSKTHDANGDGVFSIADYAKDFRVTDANGNGMIDPGDLIRLFSNGTDEDGNGYTDDICGWDFHENDNDPADRTQFGHGTAEAKDSVGTINNGYGSAGVCGNCSFFPVRVNDSFVVDANAFSAAVIYATDRGADLIQQALGSLNWNDATVAAINYAYDKNVIIIGSAADETSYHHNYPSALDPVIYTNSLRFDGREYQNSTTFLNFNNCSNYGARIDIATPGKACSSEATAMLSGVTALAISYAKSTGKHISVGQMISLIKSTAMDIDLGAAASHSERYSSFKGWDTLSGYGRTDAYAILKAIEENRIPPEVRIVSPQWFEIYNKKEQAELRLDISISGITSDTTEAVLEVARGVETAKSEFVRIKSLNLKAKQANKETIMIPTSLLDSISTNELDDEKYQSTFTFRLRTLDPDGKGMAAESRRTIFMVDDPALRKGFPARLHGSGESSGFFADLDGDGKEEFITADGTGFIHAFTSLGGELPGFPMASPSATGAVKSIPATIVASLAGGDIDGDGATEIIAASIDGQVFVVNAQGKMVSGFPILLPKLDFSLSTKKQRLSNGVLASPVLVDLDNNATLEIVIAALDGQIYAYDHRGVLLPGFPFTALANGTRAKILSSPAVIDLNGDGAMDLLFGTNHIDANAGLLFAIDGKGQPIASFNGRIPMIWDDILPTVGTGIPAAPVIGDIDGDGEEEIIIHPFNGKTFVLNKQGTIKTALSSVVSSQSPVNDTHMISAFGQPSLADVSGDGILDPVNLGTGKRILTSLLLGGKRFAFDHMIGAWNGKTGEMQAGFPQKLDDMPLGPASIAADMDGDGKEELIAGSSGFFLRTYSQNKSTASSHLTGGWLFATPSLGDFDGDGLLDLAATTREGYVFIWSTTGKVSNKSSSRTYKANNHRTGRVTLGSKK